MLVDLGRNDLGRVCEYGSVEVESFMAVENYSHVMHIVSSVIGRLREGVGALDALRSVLPAGTLSGAPKVRAMQIIDELEPVKRGGYGGAIGYASYTGDLDTCIHIRTVVVKDGVAHVQAGGGTVADAKPDLRVPRVGGQVPRGAAGDRARGRPAGVAVTEERADGVRVRADNDGVGRRRVHDHAEPSRPAQRLDRDDGRASCMPRSTAADADDEVRAVIFTGAGRAFCAGADLERGSETFDQARRTRTRTRCRATAAVELTLRIFECRKPVIAAINGPAVGIGATMTLPMDVRLASETARIGFVFARRGIVPEACSSWFLPRAGRHQPRDGVGRHRPRVRRSGGAARRAASAACIQPASCSTPPARSRARSPTTPRRCRWRSPG